MGEANVRDQGCQQLRQTYPEKLTPGASERERLGKPKQNGEWGMENGEWSRHMGGKDKKTKCEKKIWNLDF